MPLYNFDPHQEFISIDQVPDHRSDAERLGSSLNIYNQQKPDIGYAERYAEEMINVSGAPIIVLKRNTEVKDDIWEEDADPTYKNDIKLRGIFTPPPSEAEVTKWGLDSKNEIKVHFSRANVLRLFGERMIAPGDLLIIPYNTLSILQNTDLRTGPGNRMDRFIVKEATDSGNYHYRWLYWSCMVENITGDPTIDSPSKGRA